MTITREQVADLQPGDIVELREDRFPNVVTRGPITRQGGTYLGSLLLGWSDGRPATWTESSTLTVVSRAPRPLYVNHPRTGAMFGDVVRLENDGGQVVMFTRAHGWVDNQGDEWDPKRKDGLRLLVDGETGMTVQS